MTVAIEVEGAIHWSTSTLCIIPHRQYDAGTVRIWGICLNLMWSESAAGQSLHVQDLLYFPKRFQDSG